MFASQNTNIEHSTSNIEHRIESTAGASYAGPLFVWLVIQLLAIAVGAGHVKLWARFTVDQSLALDELLAVQFIASSLLFPFLCRNLRSTAAIICGSVPMCALVGIVSFNSITSCGVSALNLSMWLAGLGVWGKVAKGRLPKNDPPLRPTGPLVSVAIVGGLNLCGVVLFYLTAETTGAESPVFSAIPIIAAIRLAHIATFSGFVPALTLLTIGLITLAIGRARFSTAVIH